MSKPNICKYCQKAYITEPGTHMYCSIKCRFMSKVDKTDSCWNWTAGVSSFGYGQFSVGHRGYGAHKYSWIMRKGEPPKGLFVCHKCDNPKCVNPAHLFLGSQADNMNDKVKKKRAQKGIGCYNHKLTNEQVVSIINDKRIYKDIAKEYGISISLINQIRAGTAWRHIKIKRPKKIAARGEQASKAKLTEQQVLAIRKDTRNYKVVMDEYKISNSTYYAIRSRQYWTHI